MARRSPLTPEQASAKAALQATAPAATAAPVLPIPAPGQQNKPKPIAPDKLQRHREALQYERNRHQQAQAAADEWAAIAAARADEVAKREELIARAEADPELADLIA